MSTGELLSVEPQELEFPCNYTILVLFYLVYYAIPLLVCRSIAIFSHEIPNSVNMVFTFLVELKKQISCSMQLTNKTNNHVAFKVLLSLSVSVVF